MGTGCGIPKRNPLQPPLPRDLTQLHFSPYSDSCKMLSRFGLRPAAGPPVGRFPTG
jgi:hypothetical protein